MQHEQRDLGWLFKIGRKSLVLVCGGLIVTIASGVTVPSLAIEKIPLIAQANASVEAEQLRQEGKKLVQEGSEDSLRKAILIFGKARELSLSVNDITFEASDSFELGLIHERLKDKQQALKSFNQALVASMRKELRDVLPEYSRLYEAFARVRIGKIYDDSSGHEQ